MKRLALPLFVSIVHNSRKLARHEVLAGIVAGSLPIVVRLALLPLAPIPIPAVHDEFSYLLAADTFSHGRLTNPTHPFWQHFESFHILQQPSYMSMYPPAQAVFLALGEVFLGHPWFGLCVVFVLLGMAATWALRAWLPLAWALPGALLVGAEFGITDYWINSYWGGVTTALGGFLVVGSAGCLLNRPNGARVRNAFLLGLGILILANTRPWEGLVFCTGVIVFAGARLSVRRRWQDAALLRRWLAVVFLVLTVGGVLMAYYCWRVTGNALGLPYLLNRRTYAIAPLFFWQKPGPVPRYNHDVMRHFYLDWEPSFQAKYRSFRRGTFTFRLQLLERAAISNVPSPVATSPAGPPEMILPARVGFFLLFLLVLWTGWRGKNTRWLVFLTGFFFVGICCQNYCFFHYVAPLVGALTLLKVTAVRRWSLASRWSGGAKGVGALYLLVLLLLVWNSSRLIASVPKSDAFALRREGLKQCLQRIPGRHVVIVRYSSEHPIDQE